MTIKQQFEIPEIMNEYGTTHGTLTEAATPFYRGVVCEDNFAYCIFASEHIIKQIKDIPAERRHYYMDGTFKVVPFGAFNQLLIIYIEFFGKVCI